MSKILKDDVGNIMEKHKSPMTFVCDDCGKEIKKGDNLYQYHYTEPICEKCYNFKLTI